MKIGGNSLATQAKTAVVLRDGLQFRADLLARNSRLFEPFK
jgi:hypothetical protein